MMRFQKWKTNWFRSLTLCLISVLGCAKLNDAPISIPIPQRLRWEGDAAVRTTIQDSRDSSDRKIIHLVFGGPDSLRITLKDFSNEDSAYLEFEKIAHPEDIGNGISRSGDSIFFVQNHFLCSVTHDRPGVISTLYLRQNLTVQDGELFTKPAGFLAFPRLSRIMNSERVIASHFLGRNWSGPAFSISYPCHGDTLLAFRGYAQEVDSVSLWMKDWKGKIDSVWWTKRRQFQGQTEFGQPLIFHTFRDGVWGILGCEDSLLVEKYAEKLEKMSVLWLKR